MISCVQAHNAIIDRRTVYAVKDGNVIEIKLNLKDTDYDFCYDNHYDSARYLTHKGEFYNLIDIYFSKEKAEQK